MISGAEALGFLVEAAGLEPFCGSEARLARSARRYFAGERVKPKTVEGLHAAIATAASRQIKDVLPDFSFDVRVPLLFVMGFVYMWDRFARASARTSIPRSDLTPDSVLWRILALDLSFRLAALREMTGVEPSAEGEPEWARGDRRSLLRRLCKERGLTRPMLVKEARVTKNAADAWLDHGALPDCTRMRRLAAVLRVPLSMLRAHYLLRAVTDRIAATLGREETARLAAAVARFARRIQLHIRRRAALAVDQKEPASRRILEDRLVVGVGSNSCVFEILHLLRREEDPEWRRVLASSLRKALLIATQGLGVQPDSLAAVPRERRVELDEAIQELVAEPRTPGALRATAEILMAMGFFDDAIVHLETTLLDLGPDADLDRLLMEARDGKRRIVADLEASAARGAGGFAVAMAIATTAIRRAKAPESVRGVSEVPGSVG